MLRLAPPCLTPPPRNGRSSGSALVLTLAAFLVVVFMGALVIDGGLVYGKRAEIAKAVDAAAIAGISNLSQGQNQASQLAHDMFVANYRMTNRDAQPSRSRRRFRRGRQRQPDDQSAWHCLSPTAVSHDLPAVRHFPCPR
jgi:hypothetical protein